MKSCLVAVIAMVILFLIEPLMSFFCGYLAGVVLKWAIGDTIVNGLNVLFNTTRFSATELPIVLGALAVVGSFFKSTFNTKS